MSRSSTLLIVLGALLWTLLITGGSSWVVIKSVQRSEQEIQKSEDRSHKYEDGMMEFRRDAKNQRDATENLIAGNKKLLKAVAAKVGATTEPATQP